LTKEQAINILDLVSSSGDEYDLKSAFRKQAKKYHPDLAIDPIRKTYCHKKFLEITEAYEYLLEKMGSGEDAHQDAKIVIEEQVSAEDKKEFRKKSFFGFCLDFLSIIIEDSPLASQRYYNRFNWLSSSMVSIS